MTNRHDKEKIIFKDHRKATADTIFRVVTAGETYPDPNYYYERDKERIAFNEFYYSTGVYVLEYVKSGKGYIECEDKMYEVSAGDFYFLVPSVPHKYYSDRYDPFNKLFINIDGSIVAAFVKGIRIDRPVSIMHDDILDKMKYIHFILERADITNIEKYDIIAAKVCEILLKLKPIPQKMQLHNELAASIKQYINDNISAKTDLANICRMFYISKSNLISIFTKEYGITPHKYIIEKKIELAKRLLNNDTLTIAEVGARVGFEGEKYFYSAFKKVAMMTPGQYRRSIQRGAGLVERNEE